MKSRRNVASAPFGAWALDPTSQTSGMLHAQQLLFRMPSLFLCLGAPQSRRCWSSAAFHEIYSYMVLHSISSLSSTFVAKKQCKAHWNPFQRCSRYSTRHWSSLIGTWKSWPFPVQQMLQFFPLLSIKKQFISFPTQMKPLIEKVLSWSCIQFGPLHCSDILFFKRPWFSAHCPQLSKKKILHLGKPAMPDNKPL